MFTRSVRLAALALCAAAILLAGCSEKPVDGSGGEADVTFSLSLTSTSMQALIEQFRVTVTGDDFGEIIAPLTISGNFVQGQVRVPTGPHRTFTVDALDGTGRLIYTGSVVADVIAGKPLEVSVPMEPAVPMVRLSPRVQTVPGNYRCQLACEVHYIDSLRFIRVRVDWDSFVLDYDSAVFNYSDNVEYWDQFLGEVARVYLNVSTYNGLQVVGPSGHKKIADMVFSSNYPKPDPQPVEFQVSIARLEFMNGDTIAPYEILTDNASMTVSVTAFPQVSFPDVQLDYAVRRATGVREGAMYLFQALAVDSLEAAEYGIDSLDGIEVMTGLRVLDFDYNNINDLSGLRNLTGLRVVRLRYNDVTNLAPLVANTGIGSGDFLDIAGNPLDSASIGDHIPALRERGVIVNWEEYSKQD